MRFQAAAQHVDRGRVLRQSGDIAGALNQFTRALQIDPANEAAAQEIEITQTPGQAVRRIGAAAELPRADCVQRSAIVAMTGLGPIVLKPISNDPITLHTVEDVKIIYKAIGKLAGLNVLFDPDYTSKRIPVDLPTSPCGRPPHRRHHRRHLLQARHPQHHLRRAEHPHKRTRSRRPRRPDLLPHQLLPAERRQRDLHRAAQRSSTPDDKVYLVPSQNAIVMRATTDQLLLAQKLLNDLDRARPEVVVDVAVLEVNRDKIRNLGITLPHPSASRPQPPRTSYDHHQSTTPPAPATTTPPPNFTLNTLANLNATNFAVTITGGTLNALLSDADTRVLQNPRIRATDGQRATLKIGSRDPHRHRLLQRRRCDRHHRRSASRPSSPTSTSASTST